jgi:hypothetical protein
MNRALSSERLLKETELDRTSRDVATRILRSNFWSDSPDAELLRHLYGATFGGEKAYMTEAILYGVVNRKV